VSGYEVDVQGDDLIAQHVRFRAGDVHKKTKTKDGYTADYLPTNRCMKYRLTWEVIWFSGL